VVRHRDTSAVPLVISTMRLVRPVPQAEAAALPTDFAVLEEGGELLQALVFDRRASAAFALGRRMDNGPRGCRLRSQERRHVSADHQ
jgi:hypothetical protein